MSRLLLSGADYRFLASLPAAERRLILELIDQLDARFVDHDEPCLLSAVFFGELESSRNGTGTA